METNAPQGFFGRLGGLLGPQGLTPEEQTQMGRQGLLQMGLGILANNHDRYNAGAAVGSGLLAGISAMQKSGKDLIDRRTGTTDPATFRAQHMAAIAAGYEPGSEGYQNFFKRANGELARASSAGYSLVKFTGPDGRERIGTMSGQSGIISMPDGSTFDPQASGVQVQEVGAPQAGAFQPQGAPDAGLYGTTVGGPLDFASDAQQFASLGIPVSSTVRSAEKNRSVGGVSNSYHLTGEAMDIAPRSPQEKAQAQEYWRGKGYQVIDEGDHLHIEPPGRGMTSSRLGGDQGMPTFTPAPVFQRPSATAGVNPFVGRRPEDEAAATKRAELGAVNENFETEIDQQRRLKEQEARIEAEKAAAIEKAKAEQDRASNERAKAAQLNNVDRGLSRIDKAMKALSGGMVNTGPIDGRLMIATEAGQELDRAVNAIQNDMLALTRVPGIGSQSDLEAKISSMKYPSIYNHPSVNAENLKQLRAFMEDLRQQITGGGAAPAAGQRTIVRTGTSNGRKVVQYSDGSVEYGN